ncbi:MAG: calcium-binding protein [Pseudomonadota bacterium]
MVVRYGGSGNDFITGSNAVDTLYGLNGDDNLYGLSGNDTLFGGSGSDDLYGGVGSDTFFGGSGNDDAFGASDSGDGDTPRIRFFGGSGYDRLFANNTVNDLRFFGDANADTIFGSIQGDFDFYGGDRNDRVTLFGSVGEAILYGGSGSDTVILSSGSQELGPDTSSIRLFGSGRNVLDFANTVEELFVRGGDQGDSIFGRIQGDVDMSLGLDNDRVTLFGSVGDGVFDVGSGSDTVVLSSGGQTFGPDVSDLTLIGSGRNFLAFDNTVDELLVQGGQFGDSIFGRIQGDATLNLGADNDRVSLFGSADDVMIMGGSGNDSLRLYGSNSIGDDSSALTVFGSGGNDLLFSQTFSDLFFQGGDGRDLVTGRVQGSATITTDGGDDTVTFAGLNSAQMTVFTGSGTDRIGLFIGDDTFRPGSGVDSAGGGSGNDLILVGSGEAVAGEVLNGGSGVDTLGLILGAQVPGSATLFNIEETITLGTSANDTIIADNAENTVFGLSGDDRISGEESNDRIYGDAGDDELLGGDQADRLYGGGEDDSLYGDDGVDRLYGDANNDTLRGGSGRDSLYGGAGADLLFIGAGDAEANEVFDGGGGTDTLARPFDESLPASVTLVSIERTILLGTSGNDTIELAAGGEIALGFTGNDSLIGNDGDDGLYGGNGEDTLRGRDGDDSVYGGSANDRLFGDDGDDRLYGEQGSDRIAGGSGIDLLFGAENRDRLNGASGSDTAAGGAGNDTFIVDTAGDVLLETANGGIEDVVRSNAADFTLGSGADGHVERGNINDDAGDADLRGNEFANTLLGNSSDNRLFGFSGDDILNSNGGSNILTGGSGDDTFVVTTASDEVREFAGQGTDLVRAESDFTLPDGGVRDFIENLRMQGGRGDIDGAGNSLDNTIEGNSGNNTLRGLDGDDLIEAGEGADRLIGGLGSDRLEGESGADTIALGDGDVAFGGSGADSFFFNGAGLGSSGSGGPVIRDFDGERANAGNGEDKLVFATGLEVGSFAYIGGAAFSGGGDSEARFDGDRQVQVDQDGDGSADIAFLVDGVTNAGQLTASDFVWL